MSTELKYKRGFDLLTTEICRQRIDSLDAMIADPTNVKRVAYLQEQVDWWRGQLVFCYKREGLIRQ
jgi:hypothetical protein